MASADDNEELLLSCRYGALDEVQRYVGSYGANLLGDVRDENGNTVLHMACGNGHEGALVFQSSGTRLSSLQISLIIYFLLCLRRC